MLSSILVDVGTVLYQVLSIQSYLATLQGSQKTIPIVYDAYGKIVTRSIFLTVVPRPEVKEKADGTRTQAGRTESRNT